MTYLPYSKKIAWFLTTRAGASAETEEILAYAVEVLTLNLMNVVLSIVVGYMLGVVTETLVALAVIALLRFFAGGAHSNSPWRCTMVTVLLFPALGLLAKGLAMFGTEFSDLFSLLSLMGGLLGMVALAPVDSPSAPIISAARRIRLKVFSVLAIIALVGCTAFLRFSGFGGTAIQLAMSLAVLWSLFIITKLGHAFFIYIDSVGMSRRKQKEVSW